MENVFSKRKRESGTIEDLSGGMNKPEIKDLAKEYLKDISKLSQNQKINLVYQNLYNKKPEHTFGMDQILNRILYRIKFGKYIKDTKEFIQKKGNFKWPTKWKKVFKGSRKKRDQILVWFLNIKGEIEPPKLYPIYSSNMVIIRNRPYQVDPRSFWRMGKYTCQIIKGIDRRPVSNLDYDEVRKRGDSTDSDEFLIKAAMQAIAGGIKKKPMDKKVLVFIVIGIVAALIFFMSRGGT